MLKVNLFDSNGITISPIDYKIKSYKYIEYTEKLMDFDGITIFTDNFVLTDIPEKVKSKYKIGWLVEPKSYSPNIYNIYNHLHKFDYIFTHDYNLLKHSNKFKFCPVGECWISQNNRKIHNKNKNISIILSSKNVMEGQRLRHNIFNNFKNKIDCFGNAVFPIKLKDVALTNFRYSICVENNSIENYFTEKLIDCFMTGTIPIYWGCKNINDYFNDNGIVFFKNLDHLNNIINNIDEKYYNDRFKYICENFELAKKYCVVEDWIYENIFVDIC